MSKIYSHSPCQRHLIWNCKTDTMNAIYFEKTKSRKWWIYNLPLRILYSILRHQHRPHQTQLLFTFHQELPTTMGFVLLGITLSRIRLCRFTLSRFIVIGIPSAIYLLLVRIHYPLITKKRSQKSFRTLKRIRFRRILFSQRIIVELSSNESTFWDTFSWNMFINNELWSTTNSFLQK